MSGEEGMTHLEMAKALDSMKRDVDSWEAGLLDSVLKRFEDGKPLTPKQAVALEEMYAKYLGEDADEREKDDEAEPGEEEADAE